VSRAATVQDRGDVQQPDAAPEPGTAAPEPGTAAPEPGTAVRRPEQPGAERWELFRALGAVAGDPADARTACAALGLPEPDRAEHTEVFVLNCPPYAAVYLGAEGGLGGEAADRVAGFWRAIGAGAPTEPDHLTSLLSLYASLGEAAGQARAAATSEALTRARQALFWEHLWPWLPGYLAAVTGLDSPALGAWAVLAWHAVRAERAAHPGGWLPLALRAAPAPAGVADGLGAMLDTLVAPVRSGFVITRRSLAAGADAAGAGQRIGERRFTLRGMLEQAPAETLTWLAAEATHWSRRHAALGAAGSGHRQDGDVAQAWWAARARKTARILTEAASAAPGTDPDARTSG